MKNLENWDLRFNITDELKNILLQMLIVKQTIKEHKLQRKEKQLLENEFEDLLNQFRKGFQKINKYEIEAYKRFMSGKE